MNTFSSPQHWCKVQLPDSWTQEINPTDETAETMTFYHPKSEAALRITALEILGKDRENREFNADTWLHDRSSKLNTTFTKLGDHNFVHYEKNEGNENGTNFIHYFWETAAKNKILICTYTSEDKSEMREVEQILASIEIT